MTRWPKNTIVLILLNLWCAVILAAQLIFVPWVTGYLAIFMQCMMVAHVTLAIVAIALIYSRHRRLLKNKEHNNDV